MQLDIESTIRQLGNRPPQLLLPKDGWRYTYWLDGTRGSISSSRATTIDRTPPNERSVQSLINQASAWCFCAEPGCASLHAPLSQ